MANAQTIAERREHLKGAHAPAADGGPLRPGHTPLGVGIRRQNKSYKQPTPQTGTGRLGPCVATGVVRCAGTVMQDAVSSRASWPQVWRLGDLAPHPLALLRTNGRSLAAPLRTCGTCPAGPYRRRHQVWNRQW